MTKFNYRIKNKKGEMQNGQLTADSAFLAAEQIKKDGWYIVNLKEAVKTRLNLPFLVKKNRFSSFERIIFTEYLAAMIRAGTPLCDALEVYKDEENTKARQMIEKIIRDVQSGKELSEGMADFKDVFTPFYLAMVQEGELTGVLDETLKYLASELRQEYEFKERIKSALLYPVMVLVMAFLVIVLLTFVVIPKITQLTKSFGGELPLMTRIVSGLAELLMKFGPLIMIIFLGLIGIVIISFKNPKVKAKTDHYILKLPLVGKLAKKYLLGRFSRMVGSCLKYGIPLPALFETVYTVMGNSGYQLASQRIKEKVVKGVSLAKAVEEEGAFLFPRTMVKIIKGGEKTGTVHEALLRLADFYEAEVNRDLKRITDLIEPALVIVLGILVGGIAISVLAPIYQLTSKIK